MANDSQRRSSEPDRDQDHEDDSHDQQALLHKSSDDSSRAKQPSMTLDMLVTVTYCLVYLLVGPALILVNKKIMKVCSLAKIMLEHAAPVRTGCPDGVRRADSAALPGTFLKSSGHPRRSKGVQVLPPQPCA